MTDKFLHPDKLLAGKYVVAAFILLPLDYLIPLSGLIALILLYPGIKAFMHDENNNFKNSRKSYIKIVVAYIFMRPVTMLGILPSGFNSIVFYIGMGVSTIYYIYMTLHFTEGVLLDAKVRKMNFEKLGLHSPWIITGIFAMAHYFCVVTFKQPIPSMTCAATLVIAGFMCIKLYQAINKVYGKAK